MKKLLGFLTKPVNVGLFSLSLFVGGIVFWGGFNTFMEYTNRMEFCIGCHEMADNVYVEYQQTIHYTNRSGVRTICSDCHVPEEWWPKLKRKIRATNELFHWATGSIDTKEKYEAKRLELAQRVWDEMKGNDSHECRNCHSYDAMHWQSQQPKAAMTMMRAANDNKTCIDCHKGIAHKLPNMTQSFQARREYLEEETAGSVSAGDFAVAYAIKNLYAEAEEEAKPIANILPMSRVEVLETHGDWAKVKFSAWDREGGSDWFAKPGPLAKVGKIKRGARDIMETGESFVDEKTTLTWNAVSLTAWTKMDGLSGDEDKVRAYATSLWRADCNLCHELYPQDMFDARNWEKYVKKMRRFTSLDADQTQAVLKLIQEGAIDMKGEGQ